MRRLHLILDGLPRHGDPRPEVYHYAPSLSFMLAHGRVLPGQPSLSVAIAGAFGLGQTLSVAPHTLALDGLVPDAGLWLRADPVSLHFYQDQLVLLGTDALDVQAEEADALITALQKHFESEGLAFYAPRVDRWYLRLNGYDTPPNTVPPDAIVGRPIEPYLPRGPQAAVWRRRLNEVQMLLHDHPINRAREVAGKWPINSVWFWGGGRHLPLPSPAYTRLAARHPLARALARAAGLECVDPDRLDHLRDVKAAMVILELPGGEEVLGESLRQWEEAWFRPALRGLRRGAIRHLRLECTGRVSEIRDLTPLSAYRFWPLPRL